MKQRSAMVRAARVQARDAEADANPLHDASWLYSYADLITQLLIFAILMMTAGLRTAAIAEAAPEKKPEDPLAATVRELDRFLEKERLRGQMTVDRSADRLVIRMKSKLLFQEGQAALTAAARAALDGVVAPLKGLKGAVRVEGHTDNVPIRSAGFPSNWELSTARAISVERHLEERGLPRTRLAVAGYGEHKPIVPNDSAEHRALNRRVEIVVLGE
ncbi:MAG: OmpA family protein [Deltaproteobacteria bacterium]|nr:OmpA family protein [Deltaproteobacteria bacterium]